MKQRVLALAIKRIVWAELALTAALAPPAFAQSQPAPGAVAIADAVANGAPVTVAQAGGTPDAAATGATAPDAAAGAATETAPAAPGANGQGKVAQIKRFEVTGSLIRQADKTGFQQVQTITPKEIQASGAVTVTDFLRDAAANSANSWGEGQSGNFAAGAAGIALRGLDEYACHGWRHADDSIRWRYESQGRGCVRQAGRGECGRQSERREFAGH